jgi:uncharacterized membrane protein
MSRVLAVSLTIASIGWVAAILFAPFGLADGSIASALTYYAASLVCHQRPERSFHLAGVAMPVCARCLGLYASAAAGALAASTLASPHAGSARAARIVLALAAVPTFLTLAIEWTGLAPTTPMLRALAALPLGWCAAWIIVRMLRREAVAPAGVRAL